MVSPGELLRLDRLEKPEESILIVTGISVGVETTVVDFDLAISSAGDRG